MSRLANIAGLLLAVGMILAVGFFDPVRLNQAVSDFFGWKPKVPVPGRLVPVDVANEIRHAAGQVSRREIADQMQLFSDWGSRVPGYPGSERAYEYIGKQFEALGLENIRTDEFAVTVPIDRGGTLTAGERLPIRLYSLWPNSVRTPSLPEGGLEGPLVYGGKGELSALDGQPLEGSIVLLDFDSGQAYMSVIALGARAVVFFDNGGVNREQAADKFLKVPVNIPRYWIDREQALGLIASLRQGPVEVALSARMDWEEVVARNIYGWLPGSEDLLPPHSREHPQRWAEQTIVIHAYYDAVSVVPALAPGAENASGIIALLQLVEVLQTQRPKYSILFLATSGHFQGLAGINDFLYRHSRRSEYFLERMPAEERLDFELMLSLDLSTHSRRTITFGMGTFYNPKWQTDNYVKFMLTPYSKRLSLAATEIFADTTRHVEGLTPPKRTWKNYMPTPLALASEAAAFVGQKALTVASANDIRERVDTPLDLPEFADLDNLTRQIETLSGMVLWAARDAGLLKPTKLELEDYGHSLGGTVYWFDREVNFAVPKAPVAEALVTYQQLGPNSVGGVRTLIVDQADAEGRFRFDIMRNKLANTIKAYEIDPWGEIVSAPDMGQEGDETYPMEHLWGWWENEMMQVVFKCRALSLFETVDSQYLSVLDHLTVLNDRDGEPQSWGADYVEDQSNEEGKVTLAAVVYARPHTRVKVLMSTSLFGIRYLLNGAPPGMLTNPVAPEDMTEDLLKRAYGRGYEVDQGTIVRPAYAAARDMWILDDARIKQLARYGVHNSKFMRLHEDAGQALQDAAVHLDNRRYSAYKTAVRKAWGLEARGYPDVKSTATDTVYGIIFYFALLLPFSFFCERLFLGFSDVRHQLLGAAAFFLCVFLIMRFIHPAFKLSSSPYVIFLAFVIFAIGGVTLFMIMGRFIREVGERKRAAAGVHEVDVGRLSATAAAVTLGISNLRKRKLRTALTIVTLTLLTFTVQAFTSVETFLKFYQIQRDNAPAYEGALLRDRGWRGMQMSVLEYSRSAFSQHATVMPRAWYISQIIGERAYLDLESEVDGRKHRSFAFGLLGLSVEEEGLMGMGRHLVGESSRWFRHGEEDVCILPRNMAAILGIGPEQVGESGVVVWLMGNAFRVIGLVDGEKVDQLRDLDNESPMPVDTVAEAKKMEEMADQDPRQMATTAIETFTHLLADNIVLLPFDVVIDLGGALRSVAIAGFDSREALLGNVEGFVSRVAMPLFVGGDDKVRVYTSMGSASLSGTANLIIPLLITALIVLNTMMGAVYERGREIRVYSSVGLAPNHIAALFIAEAMVFATMGAVLGYLLGQSLTMVLVHYEVTSGMFMNYSSLSAIASTAIVMATVVASTLYPARQAAAMAVPDVTRRWKLPDPEGDDWHFDFPFTIGRGDAQGSCAYLYRVFSSYGEGSIGDFMTEGVSFQLEQRGGEQGVSEERDEPVFRLELQVWLAPYDLGVSQRVSLRMLPDQEVIGIYRIEMEIQRTSGDVASWKRLNTRFLDVLRKRFLVWRTIAPEIREEYLTLGRELAQESRPQIL